MRGKQGAAESEFDWRGIPEGGEMVGVKQKVRRPTESRRQSNSQQGCKKVTEEKFCTFPKYGVCYIAINDHFDTIDPHFDTIDPNSTDNDMAGIKNWFNDNST